MKYSFHPAAEIEYLESVAYYESKSPGLGSVYLNEFERILRLICDSPHRYPIEKAPGVRRGRMRSFPFNILFRIDASDNLQVLAVAHFRRRPQYWIGRI